MGRSLESLVKATSIVRLVLIGGVFLVNLISLIRLIFTSRKNFISSFCIHRATTATILCSNLVYLCTWLPYLFSSYHNGQWPFLRQKEHCIIQYAITGQVMTILLAALSIRKLYDCFSPKKARLMTFSLIIAWLIPQAVYLNVIDIVNNEKSTHQFLDRLLFTPSGIATHGGPNHNNIGFMLCIQRLASPIIAQLSWHYVVLVIPLTTIVFLCSIARALRASRVIIHVDSCDCSNDFALSLSLYFNLMWLLILRPLIVLQTLMMSTEADGSPPTYLDFGTHLVLIFASLSIPFSNSGGLRLESFSNQETLSSTNSCCNQSDKSSISEFDPYKTGKRVTDQY